MAAVVALIDGKPGAYGISFPDFPGCVAGGVSIDDALRRGRESLSFHVESMREVGEELPRLREVAEIETDPEFVDEIKEAVIALVEIDLPGRAVHLDISMDERLVDLVDRAAAAAGETRSGFIASAVRQRISSRG